MHTFFWDIFSISSAQNYITGVSIISNIVADRARVAWGTSSPHRLGGEGAHLLVGVLGALDEARAVQEALPGRPGGGGLEEIRKGGWGTPGVKLCGGRNHRLRWESGWTGGGDIGGK